MSSGHRQIASRVPVSRTMQEQAAYALLQVPIEPWQYSTISHMDKEIESAAKAAQSVDGLHEATIRWALESYRAFRSFLRKARAEQRFVSGDLRVQVQLIDSWIVEMRERGMRHGGVNSVWRGVASATRWVARRRPVVNPMLFATRPSVGRILPRFLSPEDASRVLNFVRNYAWRSELEQHRNAAIIGLMLLAGLRRNEVVRLRAGDVNYAAGTALIRDGKGPDGGKQRVACLPPQLVEILRAYNLLRATLGRTHPELITHGGKDRPISGHAVGAICGVISSKTGIIVAPHMLRHTYATLLRQSGVSDRVAMELMGHADLRMLVRYSHALPREPMEAAAKLRLD